MEEKKKTVFADLGQKGYREVWELQERLLEKVKAEKAGNKIPENHLLFVEHDPVYTLGKSGNEANMLISAIQLRAKHAEFIKVDRGGDITFHGPGQLVVYPVIDLESFGLGVKDYVDRLEEVVIRTIASFGIQGFRLAGATGVWLEPDTPRARKICAIGVKLFQICHDARFCLKCEYRSELFQLYPSLRICRQRSDFHGKGIRTSGRFI